MNPLESAKLERDRLLGQKIEVDRKLKAVEQTINLLEPYYGRDEELRVSGVSLAEALAQDELGITGAVEKVLASNAYHSLYPTQIRDMLIENRFELKGDNPMATIHTVLKRLVARPDGAVVAVTDPGGKTAYRCDHVTLKPPDSATIRPRGGLGQAMIDRKK